MTGNRVLRALAGLVLLVWSATGTAVTVDITAIFRPPVTEPERASFRDITPPSGICAEQAGACQTQGLRSFALEVGTVRQDVSPAGIYFPALIIPVKWQDVTVTSQETGHSARLRFRAIGISGSVFGRITTNSCRGVRTAFPGYGLSLESGANSGSSRALGTHKFAWIFSDSHGKCAPMDHYLGGSAFQDLSLFYELQTPDPQKLAAGTYTGTLSLSLGYGGEIDFGRYFSGWSDNTLDIRFTLTNVHELRVTTTAQDQSVTLQPCPAGRTCTEEEGRGGWERWMVTRITPELTGRTQFSLSSNGAFTVYLQCEQQSGPDCALRSDRDPSRTVPVRTLLTLPDNIVDAVSGATVSRRRLSAGRDETKNQFVARTYGQNRPGSVDFLVNQKDVDTMLQTRPDTYRGTVTVIFDPVLQ